MNWYKTALADWHEFGPTVTLYHGTSEESLKDILVNGIRVLDPENMLDSLLRSAGLTREEVPDRVWGAELRLRGSDPKIHLTTNKEQAGLYSKTAAQGVGEYQHIILMRLNLWLEEQGKEKVNIEASRPVVLTVELPWDKVKTFKDVAGLKEIVDRIKNDKSLTDAGLEIDDVLNNATYEFTTGETIPPEAITQWEFVEEGPGMHELN